MRVDDAGWLRSAPGEVLVTSMASVRNYNMTEGGPFAVVWHWAASALGGPAICRNLAQGIVGMPRPPAGPASWHLLIARDGTVIQSVPFTRGAWHIGVPADVDGPDGPAPFINANRTTVGIEMDNAGRLQRQPDGSYLCWPYRALPWCTIPQRRVVEQPAQTPWPPGFFDSYTPEQETTAVLVVRALAAKYPALAQRAAWDHGHFEYDFARREDPGPLWMRQILPRVLDAALGATGVA